MAPHSVVEHQTTLLDKLNSSGNRHSSRVPTAIGVSRGFFQRIKKPEVERLIIKAEVSRLEIVIGISAIKRGAIHHQLSRRSR
jgi:hypothetical protein